MNLRVNALVMGLLASCSLLLGVLSTVSAQEGESEAIEFRVHGEHFVRNDAKIAAPEAFLIFNRLESFEGVFGYARVGVGRVAPPTFVAPEVFETHLVVATVYRGNQVPTFRDVEVVREGETLKVSYRMTPGTPSTAQFAVPLIISVPKEGITKVEFEANGKSVGNASLEETPK